MSGRRGSDGSLMGKSEREKRWVREREKKRRGNEMGEQRLWEKWGGAKEMREAEKSRGASLLALIPRHGNHEDPQFHKIRYLFSHLHNTSPFWRYGFQISHGWERQREDRREVGRGNEKTGREMRERIAETREGRQQYGGETIDDRRVKTRGRCVVSVNTQWRQSLTNSRLQLNKFNKERNYFTYYSWERILWSILFGRKKKTTPRLSRMERSVSFSKTQNVWECTGTLCDCVFIIKFCSAHSTQGDGAKGGGDPAIRGRVGE